MELLKQRILKSGHVSSDNVLKVDSFLNHQLDIALLSEIGKEFHRIFASDNITKILTVEASGIAIASMAGMYFNVPVVFAKKNQSKNIEGDVFSSSVQSFTHGRKYDIIVSKKFLSPDDRILILDDFLARGNAMLGLIDIVEQSGAKLCGAGIVIEKGFQDGADLLKKKNVNLHSLAIIKSMENGKLVFG
ncbi:MAG: xanthine phosphoribosyltransferase [Clostridiales bacterium]|nr:xanthine phosphoribosyltransferase [Clostridiales bacterium]